MENSGNEAKKCLKTKHITFLNAVNQMRFARNSEQISALKEQKQPYLPKQTKAFDEPREARQVTRNRLQVAASYESALSLGRRLYYREFARTELAGKSVAALPHSKSAGTKRECL